jgi:hypothetical protein
MGSQDMAVVRDHFLPRKTKQYAMRCWFKKATKRAATISTGEFYRLHAVAKEVVTVLDGRDIKWPDDLWSMKEWDGFDQTMGGGGVEEDASCVAVQFCNG